MRVAWASVIQSVRMSFIWTRLVNLTHRAADFETQMDLVNGTVVKVAWTAVFGRPDSALFTSRVTGCYQYMYVLV